VLGQIKQILESYSINSVTGDQYYCDAIGQQLLNLGIVYKIFIFGSQTRGKIFSQVKHLLVQGKIEIPDDIELLRELRNLREEKTPRGQIDIRPTTGNDDTAVALALAVNEAITQESPLPFEVVPVNFAPSSESLGLIPSMRRPV
jgi:phage terminase large subunit-like protein